MHYSHVSWTVKSAALIICVSCLVVSVYQGGQFIAQLASNEYSRWVLFAAAAALIAAGQVLTRLIGMSWREGAPFYITAPAVVAVVGIMGYSVLTSTHALTSHAFERIDTENRNSPATQRLEAARGEYKRQLSDLRSTRNKLPSNWLTRRTEITDRMGPIQARIDDLDRQLEQVNVSVTGKTMNAIESVTGLTPERLALLFAILIDLVPLTINLLLGYSTDRRRETKAAEKRARQQPIQEPVGKKRRPDLRSVA